MFLSLLGNLLDVSPKTARNRLNELGDLGFIMRVATSEKDPRAYYILIYDPLKIDEED